MNEWIDVFIIKTALTADVKQTLQYIPLRAYLVTFSDYTLYYPRFIIFISKPHGLKGVA